MGKAEHCAGDVVVLVVVLDDIMLECVNYIFWRYCFFVRPCPLTRHRPTRFAIEVSESVVGLVLVVVAMRLEPP